MKSVKAEDAVGMVLAHDLTKIVPGVYKGAAFRKGHIVRPEDVEILKDAGKFNVFVVSMDDGRLHENDAAMRLARASSGQRDSFLVPGELLLSEASEGKVSMKAPARGLFRVDKRALYEINRLDGIALVCAHDNSVVEKDATVAAAKIIPLTIDEEIIGKAEGICRECNPVFRVEPFHPLRTAVIITGSEVYYGRIQDKFGGILKDKIAGYGGIAMDISFAPDDASFISGLIQKALGGGAEIILLSGGMAVDADDVTPRAIQSAAAEIVTYGIPLLPGAMCMIAYAGDVPVVGIPACAMYHRTTVLDMIYPRLLARERLTRDDIAELAHGGLCLHCDECRYPVCPFGK